MLMMHKYKESLRYGTGDKVIGRCQSILSDHCLHQLGGVCLVEMNCGVTR